MARLLLPREQPRCKRIGIGWAVMIIRAEKPQDAQTIERVTVEAFRNASHASGTEQFIVRELRRCNALSVSLVAEIGEDVIGHVAVSPVQVSDGADRWFGLGPLSVLPARQGQGVGLHLVEAALRQLKRASAQGCVVLGDPGYYSRFGFKPVAGLMLPGVPSAYFQAIAFGPGIPQGDVSYHPAFDAQG